MLSWLQDEEEEPSEVLPPGWEKHKGEHASEEGEEEGEKVNRQMDRWT